jgi:hypothetical protein
MFSFVTLQVRSVVEPLSFPIVFSTSWHCCRTEKVTGESTAERTFKPLKVACSFVLRETYAPNKYVDALGSCYWLAIQELALSCFKIIFWNGMKITEMSKGNSEKISLLKLYFSCVSPGFISNFVNIFGTGTMLLI